MRCYTLLHLPAVGRPGSLEARIGGGGEGKPETWGQAAVTKPPLLRLANIQGCAAGAGGRPSIELDSFTPLGRTPA